jgi:glycosyltransferase involved in cell wall biosynthesis
MRADARLCRQERPLPASHHAPETTAGHGHLGTRVVVAIPCLNEERAIGTLVLLVREWADDVLVVDDGSADRTAQIAELAGARVLRHDVNKGKGAALNSAFDAALTLGADVLVVLDGDGQHRPEEIPAVAAPVLAGAADISVGSRHLAEADGDIPRVRKLGQSVVTAATNLGSGVPLTDSQSGFRAFSRRALETIRLRSRGFAAESEMQFLALDQGLTVVEVPIEAVYVDPPKRNVFRHGIIVLDGLLRLIGTHRPLLFFAGVGMASWAVAGLFALVAVAALEGGQAVAAIAPTLATLLFLILGITSVFAGVILHSVRTMLLQHH